MVSLKDIDEAAARYFQDHDESAIRIILDLWAGEFLESKKFSKTIERVEKKIEIVNELMAYLRTPEARIDIDISETLLEKMEKLVEGVPVWKYEDDRERRPHDLSLTMMEIPNPEKEKQPDLRELTVDEIGAWIKIAGEKKIKEAAELEKAVNAQKGAVWDYLRSLDYSHHSRLWREVLAVLGKDRLQDFARLYYVVSGRRKHIDNAAIIKVARELRSNGKSSSEIADRMFDYFKRVFKPDAIKKVIQRSEEEKPVKWSIRAIKTEFLRRFIKIKSKI